MPVFQLLYGHQLLGLELPDRYSIDRIEPPYVLPAADPLQVVRDALAQPVDQQPLSAYLPAKTGMLPLV